MRVGLLMRVAQLVATAVGIAIAAVIVVPRAIHDERAAKNAPLPAALRVKSKTYLGVYAPGVPSSTTGVSAFDATTGSRADLVKYFSSWGDSFQGAFASHIAKLGAGALVDIEPTGISLAAIASGRYDSYLKVYAGAVRTYHGPVVISFGHEMNGNWYSWGYGHTSPSTFVAAWRHIVTLFRDQGASNVTWLWTVNALAGAGQRITDPTPWWPGSAYVTWVGIDGYYYLPSETFNVLFGATIKEVRKLTGDPILIAETGAAPAAGKAAKIADLFAGVRADKLLGLVWFDAVGSRDWQIQSSPSALAAFRQQARKYQA
jgi:mannan endo-1,4-beta-mannosidase